MYSNYCTVAFYQLKERNILNEGKKTATTKERVCFVCHPLTFPHLSSPFTKAFTCGFDQALDSVNQGGEKERKLLQVWILLTFPINLINLEVCFFFFILLPFSTEQSPLLKHGKLIFSTTQYVFNECRIDEETRARCSVRIAFFGYVRRKVIRRTHSWCMHCIRRPVPVFYRPLKIVYLLFTSCGNGFGIGGLAGLLTFDGGASIFVQMWLQIRCEKVVQCGTRVNLWTCFGMSCKINNLLFV